MRRLTRFFPIIAVSVLGLVAACSTTAARQQVVAAPVPSPVRSFTMAPALPSPSPSPKPTARATVPTSTTPAGWGTPTFEDNFSESALDPAVWSVYDHPDGTPPRSAAAVTLSGGVLNLTGALDARGHEESGGIGSEINQMYGRWEVRFRVDRGSGYSAVALLWPQLDTDWPRAGEIDFAEINDASRTIGHMFVHSGADNAQLSGPLHVNFTKWHTVAVEWLPGHVSFYVDGKRQAFTVTTAKHPTMVPGVEPMHLALQLDEGCDDWIPCRNASTPPKVVMQVDWVKIFAPPAS